MIDFKPTHIFNAKNVSVTTVRRNAFHLSFDAEGQQYVFALSRSQMEVLASNLDQELSAAPPPNRGRKAR